MKDITIIVPVHEFNNAIAKYAEKAFASVDACQENYKEGELKVLIVSSLKETNSLKDVLAKFKFKYEIIENNGNNDYCSQINFAVDKVETEHFSILEIDDEYTAKWFKMANDYYYGNESISIFLPVNMFHDDNYNNWQYGNTMALSPTFITQDKDDTDDIGIINYQRLEKCSLFNLTGGIFNTKDFIAVGKYKPSIQVAFNYELMLRMTKKGLKIMVVPKEGYLHTMGREGCLTNSYLSSMTESERDKWFSLAIRECIYDEDRQKDVNTIKTEEIK